MRLFPFRGGIHPQGRKAATAARPIVRLPLPSRLYVPLSQHIGSPAACVVRAGQYVLKGGLIGRAQGAISAPVHAPTSGTVAEIVPFAAPHPSGLEALTVVIDADGKDEWMDFPIPRDPFEILPELIAERVAAAGIVGMGGATFPSAVKLGSAANKHIHTLIINGGECEPFLTCDDRLMQERAAQIIDGVRILLHAIRWGRGIIAIEDNKPAAIAAMREAARGIGNIEVVPVPSLYPMGSEKQLIHTLLGAEVPAGGLATQVGVIVQNVATAYAVSEAIRYGRPLVSRVITVGGGAVRTPQNVEAPVGTLVQDLFNFCGGFVGKPARIVMGGPMMGQALPHSLLPIVKGSSGVLALADTDIAARERSACIRCGRCVSACPVGLMPLEMANRSRAGDLDGALKYGLADCIACGSCAYVCPAAIPLTQYFNYAKGELAARAQQKRKADYTRDLAKARSDRLERQAREKAEAAARRKAERASKGAAAKQESP